MLLLYSAVFQLAVVVVFCNDAATAAAIQNSLSHHDDDVLVVHDRACPGSDAYATTSTDPFRYMNKVVTLRCGYLRLMVSLKVCKFV